MKSTLWPHGSVFLTGPLDVRSSPLSCSIKREDIDMEISDLPFEVRRQLLDRIKDQIGEQRFEQLSGQIGEDGILRAAVASSKTDDSRARTSDNPGKIVTCCVFLASLGDIWLGPIFWWWCITEGGQLPPLGKVLFGLVGAVVHWVVLAAISHDFKSEKPSGCSQALLTLAIYLHLLGVSVSGVVYVVWGVVQAASG